MTLSFVFANRIPKKIIFLHAGKTVMSGGQFFLSGFVLLYPLPCDGSVHHPPSNIRQWSRGAQLGGGVGKGAWRFSPPRALILLLPPSRQFPLLLLVSRRKSAIIGLISRFLLFLSHAVQISFITRHGHLIHYSATLAREEKRNCLALFRHNYALPLSPDVFEKSVRIAAYNNTKAAVCGKKI